MSCTLVTAYYPIKSKFLKEKYLNWGSTFLKLETPLVMFTEADMVPYIKQMRGDRPIKIYVVPFTELDTWKLYERKWIQHHAIDPEKHIHTPELYAVWAQKAFFVEKAIQENPFNTEYFFWCDFGAFRNSTINQIVLNSFPRIKHLPKDKIILQAINPLKDSDKCIKEDGIYGEAITNSWNEVRLVGGLWGGGIEGCLKWKEAYHKMLDTYFTSARFAGKDQIVMLSTYLENPSLATVINCTVSGIDEWFFFEYLLSDYNVEFKCDTSYIIDR
jgi:hypothetical protein